MVKQVRPIPFKKLVVSLTFSCLIGLLPALAAGDLTPGGMDTGFDVGTGTDNSVLAMAVVPDGRVLIGGSFNQVNGINRGYLARVRKDGTLDGFNPQIDNAVYAMAVQPDSKIIVGGIFTNVNGTARHRIARLNTDGSLDTGFIPGLDLSGGVNSVGAITLQTDGKILIGGSFTTVGNKYLVRLNPDGSLDTGFQMGTGFNGVVMTVALQPDGKILVGGMFTLFNGVSRNQLARLNANGSLDSGFNPGSGADAPVSSFAVQPDQKIVIGGYFQLFNGMVRKNLARLNPDGSLDTGFVADQNGGVDALRLDSSGRLLVVGSFTPPAGCPSCQFIARYAAGSSALDPSFTPGNINGAFIQSLAVQDDGGIVVGGFFHTANPATAVIPNNLARLNPDGSLDCGFWPAAVDGWVMGAAVDDWGKTYLGGWFNNYLITLIIPPPKISRNSIVRLNGNGTLDSTFDPGFGADNWINTLVLGPDRSVYVGGYFTLIHVTARGGIAKLNPDGSVNTTFNPLGVNTGPGGGWVSALALQPDQHLLIGGFFNNVNGINQHNLARLKPNGDLDTDFKGWTDLEVFVLTRQSDGKILVGGKFTQVNGTARNYLVRLNTDGSLDGNFSPNINNEVWAIRLQADGKILIGGLFNSVNGGARPGIARLLSSGALDPDFNPGSGTDGPVAAIDIQRDGRIVIGGLFATYNGINRSGIARLNSDGSLNPDFDPGTGAGGTVPFFTFPAVRTIVAQENSKVLIGGPFDQYNGSPRYFTARLNGQSPPAFTSPAAGTAELGKPFSHVFRASGVPAPKFQVTAGALPVGISLNQETGILSGTPKQVGTFTLTLSAYNQFPPTAAQTFTLTVDNAHHYLPLILRH
jgi:uncharacterized delta-60 repeat protein